MKRSCVFRYLAPNYEGFFGGFWGMSLDTPDCTLPKQLHMHLHDDMPRVFADQANENCHNSIHAQGKHEGFLQ